MEEIQRKILDQALARGETPIDVPEIQVAAQDPLTTQAIETGAGIGSFMPFFTKGAGTIDEGLATLKSRATGVPGLLEEAAATARGADELPTQANIQALMDPYQSLVTEQATAELARQADIERNKLLAQQAGIGALGGDRGQLQLAELQYVEYKLGRDFDREEFYEEFGQGSTFPRVKYGEELLGGCQETVKYLKEQNLV